MKRKTFEEVCKIVSRIPRGKIMTYGEIAKKVGTSPRVVGFALHKNPTPITIPCHRVVGKNGYLRGYAAGLKKKKELLKKEGVKFIKGWQVEL